jgi:rsbT co-antagonist protein RsbR
MQISTNEDMYRRIVESALEMIIIHSDGEILYINQSGVNFLRASSKEEVIGRHMFDIVAEEYWEMVKERVRCIVEENKPTQQVEKKIKRYDGTLVDVEISCTPIIYNEKNAIQTVYRDITQRKETEIKLQKVLLEVNNLSAPLVPILKGIAVLPLVGTIDSDRATHLLDHIPSKVNEQNVHCLIIDFSGI